MAGEGHKDWVAGISFHPKVGQCVRCSYIDGEAGWLLHDCRRTRQNPNGRCVAVSSSTPWSA